MRIFLTIALLLIGSAAQAEVLPRARPVAPAPTQVDDTPAPSGKCLIPWDPLKLCGALTGKPEEDFQRVVKRIQGLTQKDLDYAILKAKSAGTLPSKIRLQCLQAISDAKTQFDGELKDANGNVVPRPDPALITSLEETAELVDNLSPQGALLTSCAGTAQMFKTNVLAAINAIVTGAASIAAAPAGF